jgi:hypothetical protein
MPVVISNEFVLGLPAEEYPLNHARAGFQNVLKDAVITASYSENFYPQSVIDDVTYDFWRPESVESAVTFEAFLDRGYVIDYIGIAAHNLSDYDAEFSFQYHNGTDWVDLITDYAPVTNDTIMILFPQVFTARVRLVINASDIFSIGIIYAGKAFAFERPFFLGHRPLVLNRTTAIDHKITERGLDVGHYIIKKGASTKIAINNQSPQFMRSTFLQFLYAVRTRGFFFAWRPDTYPNDIAFCWTRETLAPKNNGRKEMMDIDFSVKAI